MKTFLMLITFFVGISANALSTNLIQGNEGAYGGDEIGLEFKSLARMSLIEIEREHADLAKLFSVRRAILVLDSAEVLAVEENLELDVNGVRQQVVVVNYPKTKKVIINRSRWQAISNLKAKQALALHEVLSLIGVERTGHYPISSRFYAVNAELLNLGSCYLGQVTESSDGTLDADMEFKALSTKTTMVFYLKARSGVSKNMLRNFAGDLGVPADFEADALTYSQQLQAPSVCLMKANKVDCVDMMQVPTLVFISASGAEYPVETSFKRLTLMKPVFPNPLSLKISADILDESSNLEKTKVLDMQFNSVLCY
jgi:hypothetical protein